MNNPLKALLRRVFDRPAANLPSYLPGLSWVNPDRMDPDYVPPPMSLNPLPKPPVRLSTEQMDDVAWTLAAETRGRAIRDANSPDRDPWAGEMRPADLAAECEATRIVELIDAALADAARFKASPEAAETPCRPTARAPRGIPQYPPWQGSGTKSGLGPGGYGGAE